MSSLHSNGSGRLESAPSPTPPIAADRQKLAGPGPAAQVFRVAIAGLTPELLALHAQQHGIDGVITQAVGTTVKWGVECCVIFESATSEPEEFRRFLLALLNEFDQDCAYLTVDGRNPRLLYAAGYEIPL
jgi:hypothetical protein